MLVCGQTFNGHQQLMESVTNQHGFRFVETSEDHQITVLFCTIVSRIVTDIDAAMCEVKGKANNEMTVVCNQFVAL